MIACIEQHNPPRLCVLRWVGKTGFASVGVITACGTQTAIPDGVVQLPDSVLTGTAVLAMSPRLGGQMLKICERCKPFIDPKPVVTAPVAPSSSGS